MSEKLFDIITIGDNCYRGGPLLFAKMRRALAFAAGIPTIAMMVESEDDDDVISIEVADLSAFPLTEENVYGEWETPPDDPILYLLAHSDEEGEIKEEHMVPLVARITELEPIAYEIIKDRDGLEEAQTISHRLQWFAKQLAMAYETQKPVEFRLEPYYG